MTPAEILRRARDRIATPERWTQGAYRRDANGKKCNPDEAVCWCSVGAITSICNIRKREDWAPVDFLGEVVGDRIGVWNDAPNRTHAEVLDAFDRAIALAEAQQP